MTVIHDELLQWLEIAQLVKKSPVSYRTRIFITVNIRASQRIKLQILPVKNLIWQHKYNRKEGIHKTKSNRISKITV